MFVTMSSSSAYNNTIAQPPQTDANGNVTCHVLKIWDGEAEITFFVDPDERVAFANQLIHLAAMLVDGTHGTASKGV